MVIYLLIPKRYAKKWAQNSPKMTFKRHKSRFFVLELVEEEDMCIYTKVSMAFNFRDN